jgi:hypothetical protein
MTAKRRGFSVNVFLPTGDPEGLKVVEKSNWTGRGLVIPRAMFGESRTREELGRTGVYLLVGPSEASSLPALYVGEGDPIRQRLESHAKAKDFWTHAVAFTSKDTNLNKAHVQRLESRLVELAKAAKRCVLDNGNMPAPPSLSEADEAFAEGFLDDMLLCLPILGYGMFEAASQAAARDGDEILYLSARGIEATGKDTAAGFVVFEKSMAAGDDRLTPSLLADYGLVKERRDELVRQGVLVPCGADLMLTLDYTFSSPSLAASLLLGRKANGRAEWKAKDGRTLKDIQDAEAAE